MAKLVAPSIEYEKSYRSYLDELGDEPPTPWVLGLPCDGFAALIAELNGDAGDQRAREGFVPHSTHWWVDGTELLAVSNLRHHLNERLETFGGHIGYGVRPSARGRGVAQALLAATLEVAAQHGIERATLTSARENPASARVIIANGGEFDSEYTLPEHPGVIQRYFVSTGTPNRKPDSRKPAP